MAHNRDKSPTEMEDSLEKTELYRVLTCRLSTKLLERVSTIARESPRVTHLRDRAGNTCLHLAAARTSVFDIELAERVVYVLGLADVDVNAVNSDGETALHIAIRRNAVGLVRSLLRVGVDPSILNNAGHEAIAGISTYPWDKPAAEEIFAVHQKFYPGLVKAVKNSNLEDIERICQCWCRIHAIPDRHSHTFCTLTEREIDSTTESILERYQGRNDLILATLARDHARMRSLVNLLSTPDFNCYDITSLPEGQSRPELTLLDAALPDVECVKILVDHGADVNNCNSKGPIFMYDGHIENEILHELLLRDADLSMKDAMGRTLLALFGTSSNYILTDQMIDRLILDEGVALEERDCNGESLRDACINVSVTSDFLVARRSATLRHLDSHIHKLIESRDYASLEKYTVNGYGYHVIDMCRQHQSEAAKEVMVKIEQCQKSLMRLNKAAQDGDIRGIDDVITNCPGFLMFRDFAGRSILMITVLHERYLAAEYITRHYPETLAIRDNMKRNALHYTAHLPGSKGEQLRELIYKCGGESDAVDVHGLTPADYLRSVSGDDGCVVDADWLINERLRVYNERGLLSYFYRNMKRKIEDCDVNQVRLYIEELQTNNLTLNDVHKLRGHVIGGEPYTPLLFTCVKCASWRAFDLLLEHGADYEVRFQESLCSSHCIEDPNSCDHYAKTLEEYGGSDTVTRLQAFKDAKQNEAKMAHLKELLGSALAHVASSRPLLPVDELASRIVSGPPL